MIKSCYNCGRYFDTDEDYEMSHCGGSYLDYCEACEAIEEDEEESDETN